MDSRQHRKLDVWKMSMEFVREIYQVTESFPKSEVYGLTSQMRRSAISIPSNPVKQNMYFVYVLKSLKDSKFYTGFTRDLNKRLLEHNEGTTRSTKFRRPLELIYYEACRNRRDALHREKYLKTTYGKRYLKNRLANDLLNQT